VTSPTPPPDTLGCLWCADWKVTLLLPPYLPPEMVRALIEVDLLPPLRAHVMLEHPERLADLDAQIAARGAA
jgi:hypothetical protein